VYRIEKPLAAVHFDLAAKGQIIFLPKGAELRVVGPSCVTGCFEVLCEERLYNIFEADLLGPWSVPRKPRQRIRSAASGRAEPSLRMEAYA
jgi:hypothetical protein